MKLGIQIIYECHWNKILYGHQIKHRPSRQSLYALRSWCFIDVTSLKVSLRVIIIISMRIFKHPRPRFYIFERKKNTHTMAVGWAKKVKPMICLTLKISQNKLIVVYSRDFAKQKVYLPQPLQRFLYHFYQYNLNNLLHIQGYDPDPKHFKYVRISTYSADENARSKLWLLLLLLRVLKSKALGTNSLTKAQKARPSAHDEWKFVTQTP